MMSDWIMSNNFSSTSFNKLLETYVITVNSEIFAKLFIFVKIKSSQFGAITLSFTDIGKSCPSHKF